MVLYLVSLLLFFLLLVVVPCRALPDPLNGTVMWDGLTPGSVATYSCDEGFELNGVRTRTCQNDGTWSDDAPTCERMYHK